MKPINKKTIKELEILNEGYSYLIYGLKQIKKVMIKNNDANTFMWRIEKNLDNLQKIILKELKSKEVDNEFGKIIRKMK